MLAKTEYTVNLDLLEKAVNSIETSNFRTTINKPTGNFFYDPWVVADEFKGTVWEEILSSIKEPVGEARFIILEPRQSYHVHADIDDRFHLNLKGEHCYLSDLNIGKMHKLSTDGIWYDMDAGRLHTASNFGRFDRVQLVVRKNLIRSTLQNLVHVKVLSNIPTLDDSRFMFDNKVSPWLNTVNKSGRMNNFNPSQTAVEFDVDEKLIPELKFVLGNNFRLEI